MKVHLISLAVSAFMMAPSVLARDLTHSSVSSKKDAPFIFEASPLKGLMGQAAIRGEMGVWNNASIGVDYSSEAKSSERVGFEDRSERYGVDLSFYPFMSHDAPAFVGLGVKQENALIGRQRMRDGRSWEKTESTSALDTWVNEDQYVSVTQFIGYRIFAARYFTSSLRLIRDEVVHSSSKSVDSTIYSSSADARSLGRDRVRTEIAMHVGIAL